MEAYLPMIQSVLLDWYRLTLENKEYAGSLAIAVWLLTAMFYSIRIYFLKRTNAINLKARIGLQTDLESAQQQAQSLQAQLAESAEQLEKQQAAAANEAQRAAGLEEKLVQGNRQLIDSIKTLTSSFELSEPTLPAANNLESAELWQRYAVLSAQISERFKAEQQGKTELQLALWTETSKVAEKDALLGPLQLRLDAQTEQLNKLELAVEEQKILLERQQDSAKKILVETVEKHQAELARYADLAKRQPAPAVVQAEPAPRPEPKITVSEVPPVVIPPKPVEPAGPITAPVAPAAVEPPKTVKVEEPVKADRAEPATAKQSSVDKLAEKSGGFGRFKQMLNNTMQQVAKFDQKLGTQTNTAIESVDDELQETVAPVVVAVAELKENAVEIAETVAEAVKEPPAGVGGKLKNLFGKNKPAETEVELQSAVVEPEPMIEPVVTEVEPAKPDRLKGLFKKWK
ncbi:hypothetical protein QZJ86_06305 [Methylomonas montana]|uniref:hypothetical protein n=1 Tax=Methylomonas montana TaxID=3058963 RepID=UPI00265AE7B7|nr:hypothetical protein [Methylomonas montana]WKJ91747.1 hypothetical protein QZJ86_06305 [Methylomonas montana]